MTAYATLELIVREEPAPALQIVKGAVHRGGAIITHATRFSNKALSFQLELEARHAVSLRAALVGVGQLASPGHDRLGELQRELTPEAEILVFLHVTLVHDAADERIELPKVPG